MWRGVGDEVYTSVVRAMAVSGRGHRVSVVAAGPVEWLVCFSLGSSTPLATRQTSLKA